MQSDKRLASRFFRRLGVILSWPFRHWRIVAVIAIILVVAVFALDKYLLHKLEIQRKAIRKAGSAARFYDLNFPRLDYRHNAAVVYRYAFTKIEYIGEEEHGDYKHPGWLDFREFSTARLCERYRSAAVCEPARRPHDDTDDERFKPLSAEELDLMEKHIADNEESFRLLRDAVAIPECRFLEYEKILLPGFDAPKPELDGSVVFSSLRKKLDCMRALAGHGATRAVWEYNHGNLDEAYEWVGTVMHLANDADSEPMLTSGLARLTCAKMGFESLQVMLCEDEVPDPMPSVLLDELNLLADRSTYAKTYEGERCFSNAQTLSFRRDFGVINRVLLSLNQLLLNDMFTSLMEAAGETDYETRKSIIESIERIPIKGTNDGERSWVPPHRSLAVMVATGQVSAIKAFDILDAKANGACLAIALKQYKQNNGEYPGNLSALTPDYIETLPQDPFSGNDFIYRREGEGFAVYSVGANGNDDGATLSAPDNDDLPWFATR